MRYSIQIAIFSLSLFISNITFAQITSVNQFTGSVSASIPLYTVRAEKLQVPIVLSYYGNGISVDHPTSGVGIGWNLSFGGSISRTVRDLPDDFKEVTTGVSKYGWLHSDSTETTIQTSVQKVKNFAATHQLAADCDHTLYDDLAEFGGVEAADDLFDLEPDIFNISVPGQLSMVFTLDENGDPVFLRNQEAEINISYDAAGLIESFEVISKDRTRYLFEKHMEINSSIKGNYIFDNTINYRRDYAIVSGGLQYTQVWNIKEMEAETGESIRFLYEDVVNGLSDEGNSIVAGPTNYDTLKTLAYDEPSEEYVNHIEFIKKSKYTNVGQLAMIETDWETVSINYNEILLPEGKYKLYFPLVTSIRVEDRRFGAVRTAHTFDYTPIKSNEEYLVWEHTSDSTQNDTIPLRTHMYLNALIVDRAGVAGRYVFRYNGVSGDNMAFTDRGTEDQDMYGFYSPRKKKKNGREQYLYPNLTGLDRFKTFPFLNFTGEFITTPGSTFERANVSRVAIGSLKSIITPTGGKEDITYELNRFYNASNDQDEYAGGLRVSKIRVHDGLDYENDLEVAYSYRDENGNSSGELMYQPSFFQRHPFHFKGGQNRSHYQDLVVQGVDPNQIFLQSITQINSDLTRNDYPGYGVAYTRCEVSRKGFGSTVSEYSIEKNYSTSLSSFVDGIKISPFTNGVNTICQSGMTASDHIGINYGLEYRHNGQMSKSTQYDEEGSKVSETINTFTSIGNVNSVYGLKSRATFLKTTVTGETEGFIYGVYKIDFGVDKMVTKTVTKTFDPADDQKHMETVVDRSYDAEGKLLIATQTNAIGEKYRTKYTYPGDYNISNTFEQQNEDVQAISKLLEQGRDFIPLEVTKTMEVGGVEKTISGSLSTWEYYDSTDLVLPKSSYVLNTGAALTDFQPSTVVNSTTATLDMDDRYDRVSTITSRQDFSKPTSVVGRGTSKSTTLYFDRGRNVSTQVSGASRSEVVLEDYHNSSPLLVTVNGSATEGRIVGNGSLINSLSFFKKRFSFTPEAAGTYYFSCWLKSSTAVDLDVSIKSGFTTVSSKTVVSAGSSDWIYHSFLMEVDSGQQELTIETSANATIDDIAFYPEYADFSYIHHGPGYLPVAQTNRLGHTSRIDYDQKGNPTVLWNKDGEITAKYQHTDYSIGITMGGQSGVWQSGVGAEYPRLANTPLTLGFYTSGDCSSFLWNIVPEDQFVSVDSTDFSQAIFTTASEIETVSGNTYVNSYLEHTFLGSPGDRWVVLVKSTCNDGYNDKVETTRIELEHDPVVIELCHDRPTSMNTCFTDEENYIDCSGTRVEDKLHLRLNISGGSGNYHIKWEKASANGGHAPSLEVFDTNLTEFSTFGYHGFTYRYIVTDIGNGGREYTGKRIAFTSYQGTENCPGQ